jgi:hypothetical protein
LTDVPLTTDAEPWVIAMFRSLAATRGAAAEALMVPVDMANIAVSSVAEIRMIFMGCMVADQTSYQRQNTPWFRDIRPDV